MSHALELLCCGSQLLAFPATIRTPSWRPYRCSAGIFVQLRGTVVRLGGRISRRYGSSQMLPSPILPIGLLGIKQIYRVALVGLGLCRY